MIRLTHRATVLGMALLCWSGVAHAAPAPAGTLIQNQATVSYFDSATSTSETVSSNIVVTVVNAVKAITVTDDQTVHLPLGSAGQFRFTVRNTGNVDATPVISLTTLAGGDVALTGLTVTIDVNRNGSIDPGEPEISLGSSIDLPIGAETDLIVSLRTPPNASDGQQAVLQLGAADGEANGASTGTVIIAPNGLTLDKAVDKTVVTPGGTLAYTLSLHNSGIGAVAAMASVDSAPIVIDGTGASGILVRDAIPLNTRFAAFGATAGFTALYHIGGAPAGSFVTVAPGDLTTVDAVGFFRAGDYPPESSADLGFSVTVSDTASTGVIPNLGMTWQFSGGGTAEVRSNTVGTTVTGNPANLDFTSIGGDTIVTTPVGSNVALLLRAGACNTTAAADHIEIQLTTTPGGDIETVSAVETGPNTGVFSTTPIPVENIAVVHGDQVISADRGTEITATATCSSTVVTPTLGVEAGEPVTAPLQLEKAVNRTSANRGDTLVYTLTVTNPLATTVTDAVATDHLPAGLTYLTGTARSGDTPITASGGNGSPLLLTLGTIPAHGGMTVIYMVRVDSGASGRLANTAVISGQGERGPVQSNEGRAVVAIATDAGVFADDSVILGKVYIDFNRNGRQDGLGADDAGGSGEQLEPGIPGVKLQFSSGASVVTDAEGKYSLPGIPSGAHAVTLVGATLPPGVAVETTRTRDMLSPASRLVRQLPGSVSAEYFAVVPAAGTSTRQVWDQVQQRRKDFAKRLATPQNGPSDDRFNAAGDGWLDYRDGPAGGAAASKGTLTAISQGAAAEASPATGQSPALSLPATRPLDAEITSLSPALGFIDLKPNDLLESDVVSVRIKGPADGTLALNLNGTPVPAAQLGQRASYAGVQAAEYVAIRLASGRNRLDATYADPFGNVRQRQSIDLLAPGEAARIKLVVPPTASADPASPIPVLIKFVDASGVPTLASMDVTLETTGSGRWGADDIRPTEPGLQIFVDHGEALVDYYPPALVGTQRLAVSNGLGRFEAEVKLTADDSERVIAGVVEGVVGLAGEVQPSVDGDGFASTATGVGGELYLRGKIRGDALLTLRYDSDQDASARLFRDVDPERYYPVYGDSSERGYDAQSRSQLFVKVEKGLNYILYGDVDVAPQASEIQLGGYSRALTGARAHGETGPVTIDLFAGRTSQNQLQREFPAEGLSGPYDIDLTDLVEGSEQVSIITRDRRQPASILRTVELQRYSDYRLDYFDNTILFSDPVPATDDAGNPNFVRVTFEVESSGPAYWVYSGEARYKLNDHVAIGFREMHAQGDGVTADEAEVRSGYVSGDFGKYGKGTVELAQSLDDTNPATAERLSYELVGDAVTVRLTADHVDAGFLENGAAASGRDEVQLKGKWSVQPGIVLRGSALYDRAGYSGDERYGGELLGDWNITPELTATGGIRYLRLLPGDGSDALSVPSVVLGGEWHPKGPAGLSVKGEVEADLADLSHLGLMVEASHQVTESTRLYLRSEWATPGSVFLDNSSPDSVTGGTLKAGLEYKLGADLTSYSELRSGAQQGVAAGVDGKWKVGAWFPGATDSQVYAKLEAFQPYDLDTLLKLPFGTYDATQSSEISVATGYRTALGKEGRLSLDAELALKDGGYTAYAQQYWSRRLGNWTWAVENRLAMAATTAQDDLRDHARVGAAFRPGDQRIDGLAVAGLEIDNDGATGVDTSTAYWTAGGSWSIDAATTLTARQAGQYARTAAAGVLGSTFMLLGQAGVERDVELAEALRLRVALTGTVLGDALNPQLYAGVGGEIGFVPAQNVMVSAGYNWLDGNPTGLSAIYTQGPYLRLSVKLDDDLWNVFDAAGLTVPSPGDRK